MRDPARLQAAIEILDEVITAASGNGATADTLVQRYFAARRYAGSKDRAAVRDLVYQAIRFTAERPVSGRAAMLGLAETQRQDLLVHFDGTPHAPAPISADEPRSVASLYPKWLFSPLSARFGARLDEEARALAGRAPLDLRVNTRIASVEQVAAELHAQPITGLPNGLRLETPINLEKHPLMLSGAIEIQDAASQRVVQVSAAKPGENVLDLCAGAGGKTLGLAADMQGQGHLIASDTDRGRLQSMTPRLERAGLSGFVQHRLLNPGREVDRLQDLKGQADLVLVDAPCSGTGTWRRNPELRWRLDVTGLEKLVHVQARLLRIGANILKPNGRLVYAVCSVLPTEGKDQAEKAAAELGLIIDHAQSMSPASDGCDGFFVASLRRPG